ncbi:glycosyltransferase family 2 protein [Flavobacterium sp. LB3P122]|uniref:glycosyltransferase family 2 protein n=1 Tax=Flavobacterium algoriphilum TaxID=3398738 RepID=UPI003A88D101
MNPLISIIIPTYNRAHLISETLDSIIAQTYTAWECIIVDDGSTDNTVVILNEYLKKDSRFQYHHRPETKLKGPSACRNYGLEKAKGEFINWFDSDDLYFPNALSTWIKQFGKETDVVVAKLVKIDFKSGNEISENSIFSNNIIEDFFIGKIAFYVCGPLWRKSFLNQQVELFDENIRNLDDWDFNLRMLYQNPNIVYINLPLIQYRFHEHSLTKEISKLNFEELMSKINAFEKHLELIRNNKKANIFVLKTFYKNRCKFILRLALVQNNNKKVYFFKKLLITQLKLFDFRGIMMTVFGYVFFRLFNKGYVFFK